jgi:hypothetical protein
MEESQRSRSGREESEGERADRNLSDLLGELRVALPGVQVLFAFLLTVPFTQRFGDVTQFQKGIYFGTLICAASASALLIAPTAFHRITFHLQDKEHIVRLSNSFAIAGLAMLALAMSGVMLLITDLLFSATVAVAATGLAALTFGTLWFGLPLRRRMVLARRERQG